MPATSAVQVVIDSDTSGLEAGLRRAQAQMTIFDKSAQALSIGMKGFTTYAMSGAISLAAMVIPAVFATQAVGDFNQSLTRIAAIGGAEIKSRIKELGKDITDLAIKWGISEDQIAEGTVRFVKAGITSFDTIEKLTTGAAKLATLNQEDFANVSDVLIYAYSLFGDKVKDVNEMMENIQTAASAGVIDIGDLGSAFQYAGSSMKIAGLSFNEVLATFTSLSNIAYKSSQNVGTLVNRLLVNGKEFEKLFGMAPGSVVSEGKVNLTGLITILSKIGDKGYEATEKVAELFGVRSVAAFNALMVNSKGYLDILTEINGEHDNLNQGAEEMAKTIPQMLQSISSMFTAQLKDTEMMKRMSDMLESIGKNISEQKLPEKIAEIVLSSINYLTSHGAELVGLVGNLVDGFLQMMPVMAKVASSFLQVAAVITKINPAITSFLVSLFLLNRIIPITTILRNLSLAFETAGQKAAMAGVGFSTAGIRAETFGKRSAAYATMGLMGIIGGFSLFMSSSDDWGRAIGVLVTAISGLAVALTVINALSGPGGWTKNAGAILSAVATTAAMGGLLYTTFTTPAMPTELGLDNGGVGGNVINDNSITNNFGVDKTDTENSALSSGGYTPQY